MWTTRTVTIECPIHDVFQLIADPRRFPAWDASVRRVWSVDQAAISVGSLFDQEIDRDGRLMRSISEVIAYQPPRQFDWQTTTLAEREITRMRLEAVGMSTLVRLRRYAEIGLASERPESGISLSRLRDLAISRKRIKGGEISM